MNFKKIPHNKPSINNDDVAAAVYSLSKLELTIGDKVRSFENKFSEYIGLNSVAVSSGTSALHLALISLSVGEGDEVILPSYTCVSVGYPILYQNAIPVLVDCNSEFNINISNIVSRIGPKTKAIVVPHMFGNPAEIQEIKEICEEKSIFLIEDCCQSLGSTFYKKKVGQFGDISIFSFYATKMMTSIQGGMICSRDKDIMSNVKDIRYPDQESSNDDVRLKFSYEMSDISASIGISQLGRIECFINRRREIANMYRDGIKNVDHPFEQDYKKHVYSRYVIKTTAKDYVLKKLNQCGVMCTTMHLPPLHEKKIFSSMGGTFPSTESAIAQGISLPIYPDLKDEDIHYIIENANKVVSK